MSGYRYDGIMMSSQDFIRAMAARPWWARVLFRLVCGRYAYSEFLMMIANWKWSGIRPFEPEYGLHDCEYHNETRLWKWWDESWIPEAPKAAEWPYP